MTESVMTKLLERLSENQIAVTEIAKQNKMIISRVYEKIEELTDKLSNNTEVLNSTNSLISDFKDMIKEFSIYASNREKHDEHLSESMEMLAETWKESLSMFAETKDIVEKIYQFSSTVSDENLGVLKRIDGKFIPEISALQERFVLGAVEVYTKFSYGFTHHFILNKVANDLKKKAVTDRKSLPQYLDINTRHKWYSSQVDKYGEELGVTEFGCLILKFFHIIFICSIEGSDYATNKYFGQYVAELGKFDQLIYDDYE